jgi:hypothetical protein
MRMIQNRNLGLLPTAKTFYFVTGRYWSAATYGVVGHGRKELTADLLADFCAVLDVAADDLAALTGVAMPDGYPGPGPAAGLAELIWDVRRLTESQIQHVVELAQAKQ